MFNPGNSNKGAGGESKEALLRQAEEARQQRLVEKKKVYLRLDWNQHVLNVEFIF